MSGAVKRYVLALPFNLRGSHLLLQRKIRPDWQEGLLNGIGGHVEDGETPPEALIREVQEEVGALTSAGTWDPFLDLCGEGFVVTVARGRFPDRVLTAMRDFSKATEEPCKIVAVEATRTDPAVKADLVDNLLWMVLLALDPRVARVEVIEHDRTPGDTTC
jgi:8-oxo-dGTP diphosphatase